jgi:hypothetical protein
MNTNQNLTESLRSDLTALHEMGKTIQGELLEPGQVTQLLAQLRRINARVQELQNRALGYTPPRFGDGRNYFSRQPHAVG